MNVNLAPLVEMRGISKTFPGVRALDDVSLAVSAGEVHMLVGQNGAGKSTLIKVLCGAQTPDHGEFLVGGKAVRIRSVADARRLGIAVIFQEFSLVPFLNVAQNIFLGRELRDRRRMHAEAARLLEMLGSTFDTHSLVTSLGVAQQQTVEIAKALSQNARILVMDEPTAALSEHEIVRLFDRIRKFKQDGIAIIYISHRLKEVFEIGDRITILRDGQVAASMIPSETSANELVRLMVGREVDMTYGRHFCERPGEVVLETRALAAANGVHDANIQVRMGEIVGLAGLVGAGRTELVRAIFGADQTTHGEVLLDGKLLKGGPAVSVARRVGLVPESRKTEGLALIRSVHDNLLVAGLPRTFPNRSYRFRKATRIVAQLVEQLRIATPSPQRLTRFLSGGNQQKVVIGKWLNAGSRFFIFDEPTRGIDVGAKAEIFRLLDNIVAQGAAVLMISSELPEIVSICDRAYVMRDRTIAGELLRNELTEENILRLAMHHA
jgi:ribose transport system ATP-binding protein